MYDCGLHVVSRQVKVRQYGTVAVWEKGETERRGERERKRKREPLVVGW